LQLRSITPARVPGLAKAIRLRLRRRRSCPIADNTINGYSRLFRLALASVLVGLAVGIVGGIFRWCLLQSNGLRDELISWAHRWPYVGWLVPVAVAGLATALARYLVIRFAPAAGGSGIQRVEAVMANQIGYSPQRLLPVKFFGGILSLGAGMALGREGPTVQIGASISHLISPRLVRSEEDQRVLLAAGSGAGLAVAFNAPIGGSIFVFEELTSKFTPWLLLCTLGAASFAVAAMRYILGNHFDFLVPIGATPPRRTIWLFLLLGALLGVAGAFYNRLMLFLLKFSDHFPRIPTCLHAGAIGGIVGLIAWFSPWLVGGGETLTQSLFSQPFPLYSLCWIFAVRFLLGPLCYSAETPGGMFAPMIFVGSSFGALFGGVAHYFSLAPTVTVLDFAVIGMAGLFAASVRAPLTGLALSIEMTGRGDLTLGMLAAAFSAFLFAMLLKSEPIYESLRDRMLVEQSTRTEATSVVAGGSR
jgi:chloride channel protein, CIC family